ncbi:STAS-like domain-containing protein [Pseudomonas sp. 6D_7.1_Bac1]|uniref:STAS-like domain-containing protein n=1 Tax=Pseudomonas sp. 6D_7.1_Bac1 TaxID=2971615 RepID=UPI0021CA489F|nr:STAS-like domain-containing protein [Pseudomonas sp. 6D_7.1_Bac1]MCU1751608.1 STAS-like domain-containing protein [Pseudomonas sp. 6D_7.1_Bac1]
MEAYTFQHSDLASRTLASRERSSLTRELASSEQVVIDLKEVESISESFADELFGVLVMERGFDFVIKHVKIINAADDVLRSIAIAMKRRCSAAA